MSLRSKFFTGITVAVAAGAFAVGGFAQSTGEAGKESADKAEKMERKGFKRGEGFGKGMRGGKFGRMGRGGFHGLRGIELTEDQRTAIKAIFESNHPDQAALNEMKSIRDARRDGTLTPEQQERAKQLRAQSREKAEMMRLQIEGVLTPEQRQQIETRKQEMRQRMEQRREQFQQRRQERLQKQQSGEKPADN